MDVENQDVRRIILFLNDPKIFFEELHGDGIFNFGQFYAYTNAVYEASKSDLLDQEQYIAAVTIWEISYKILAEVDAHLNDNDFTKISNLSLDQATAISDVLYYTANWFSYRKDMDPKSLTLEGWK